MKKTAAKGVSVQTLSRPWLRGPAWIDGDSIVMDCAQATAYQPLADLKLGLKLARVHTPEDAVVFVRNFGLLRSSPDLSRRRHEWPKGRPPRQNSPSTASEPVTDFLHAARELHEIVEMMIDVRKAAGGDEVSMEKLRQFCGFTDTDDRTLLIHCSHTRATQLNDGLLAAKSAPFVYDRAQIGEPVNPGTLRLGVLPDTLLGVCFLTVALALADKEPVAICQEATCCRPFFVTDGRQKFCTAACSNRSRYRVYKANHPHPRKTKGTRHGKARTT